MTPDQHTAYLIARQRVHDIQNELTLAQATLRGAQYAIAGIRPGDIIDAADSRGRHQDRRVPVLVTSVTVSIRSYDDDEPDETHIAVIGRPLLADGTRWAAQDSYITDWARYDTVPTGLPAAPEGIIAP